ncbi:hypothetical protein GN958_ATG10843 [Phytophthora infestans]|uniref:Uncharacterized protein n=1 Tax=Phytophthora infestans TaxID=4787 RepID=A0A8S9UKH3_PHYIN|nr:hypothetical protein GN958_ATG10843 [Phytophthora infestans]
MSSPKKIAAQESAPADSVMSVPASAGTTTSVSAQANTPATERLPSDGNPTTVPSELFEAELGYFTLGGTKLTELPQYVAEPSTALSHFDVTDTGIWFFWSWMDPLVEDVFGVAPLVAAGGTPYCYELESIMSGSSPEFSAPFQIGHSPLLMNASIESWDTLVQAVDCSPSYGLTIFPLKYWDARYGLSGSDL